LRKTILGMLSGRALDVMFFSEVIIVLSFFAAVIFMCVY
jgi:hypothetical protein